MKKLPLCSRFPPLKRVAAAFVAAFQVALLLGSPPAMPGIDESKPYGRVCFSVIDPKEDQEEVLRPKSRPGESKRIAAHVDANSRCDLLIVAFNSKTGQLANNWFPQLVELAEWEEVRLPKSPVVWNWATGAEPFEFYALFLDPASQDAKDLQALVTAMLKQHIGSQVLSQQTVRLRELATRSIVQPEKYYVLSAEHMEIGGTFRGASMPWRRFASAVNFSETKPGLLIFRDWQPDAATESDKQK